MSSDSNANTGFADRYQSVLVPVIFEPWARELLDRVPPSPGDDVLDLACGTGVVTRAVLGSGVSFGSMTSADHSAEMLGVARRLGGAAGGAVNWVEADAGALPFENDSFDLTYCQQALQFFPDRPAALAELRRVLRPGGRAGFGVQRDLSVNPLLEAQAAALEKHAGPAAAAAVRAICGLPDGEVLRSLFKGAGFRDVVVESATIMVEHPDGRAFAAGAMGGMHTGDKLSGMDRSRIEDAVADFLDGLGDFFDGTGIRVPHVAHIVTAVA